MENKENPIFGRKIFFLNPSFVMEHFVLEHLKKNEYEVYLLNDIRKVKAVLCANPNSMLFINIDSEMSYSRWFNFVTSFSGLQELESIHIGLVSEKAGWEDREKFSANLDLKAGFIHIERKDDKLLNQFVDILEEHGAKGRRKYLRLDTRLQKDVSGYMSAAGRLYTFDVRDISSAGFAITYKKEIINLFQKNTLVRNLSLSVGRKSMVCSCIVFNTQLNTDGTAMSVLMLTNENPESSRNYIRNYIFEKYNAKMSVLINDADKDTASYSDPDTFSKLKVEARRNEEDDD